MIKGNFWISKRIHFTIEKLKSIDFYGNKNNGRISTLQTSKRIKEGFSINFKKALNICNVHIFSKKFQNFPKIFLNLENFNLYSFLRYHKNQRNQQLKTFKSIKEGFWIKYQNVKYLPTWTYFFQNFAKSSKTLRFLSSFSVGCPPS